MPVRPPSLRAIAAFEAAARHESFTEAADELNLTQSAISHAVRSLELRLGVELFTRLGRTVALTEAGRMFVGRLRLSLSLISEAFDVQPKPVAQTLTVAGPPCLVGRVLAPRLPAFVRAHPDVRVNLRTGTDGGCEADVVLSYGAASPAGLSGQLLAREALIAVAAPRADLPVRLQDMGRANLVHQPDLPWRLWLDQMGCAEPLTGGSIVAHDAGAAIDCARAGLGVTLARRLLVVDDLTSGRLVQVFAMETPLAEAYWASWNPARVSAAAGPVFADWLAEDLRRRAPEPRIAEAA